MARRPPEEASHRVPIIVHFEALRAADLDLAAERDKRYAVEKEAAGLAVEKALSTATALAEKHNDLIRAAEARDATYATKEDVGRLESWQTRLTGGMVVIAIIGVSNLVKIWGH
jgi:hypothetical protein